MASVIWLTAAHAAHPAIQQQQQQQQSRTNGQMTSRAINSSYCSATCAICTSFVWQFLFAFDHI